MVHYGEGGGDPETEMSIHHEGKVQRKVLRLLLVYQRAICVPGLERNKMRLLLVYQRAIRVP